MPTVSAGSVAEVYCPLDSTITVTPGTAGTAVVRGVKANRQPMFVQTVVNEATAFTVNAGSTVFIEARGVDATYTDPALSAAEVAATQALVSRDGITASDAGSDWIGAPSVLSFSAVLASGSSTTVLLEVRDAAGTVATAATIVCDTVSQTLRQAFLLRQQSEYRFRRSSGTGSVTITT